MSRTIEAFEALVTGRNCRFIGSEGNAIAVTHSAQDPASERQILRLEQQLKGASPDLIELYRRFDGVELFGDGGDQPRSLYFAAIGDMDSEKRELGDWLKTRVDEEPDYEYGEEVDDDGFATLFGPPPWWDSVVVFGGFASSPTRFFVATEGPYRGQIFAYEHDGDYCLGFCHSSAELIKAITDDPAAFMRSRSHSVYYDVQAYEDAR